MDALAIFDQSVHGIMAVFKVSAGAEGALRLEKLS
jgi:hypothetical protein